MREQRGMSGRQLAKRLGVANTTITDIENGTTPKIELFAKIVDALELNAITAVNFLPPYRQLYQQIVETQKGIGNAQK
ncbi:MAG: helix-turn-helix transcriptional regulator [Pseudonocardiales bacterium]|nr:helix-turn-helix transcriptional regulator [Pseudonocardiales bacterium]